jgi:glycosyltransferase involved in cell wall biosynthesis
MMLDLTIAIPVRNEERNLKGCLEAIGTDLARRVVVLDSGSTDHTCAIARSHGAEAIDFQWNGRFPKKRNWFLRHHLPSTQWVFFLDADEYLTEAFKLELRSVLPATIHAGFNLNYSIHFLGRKLKGGYPLQKLALFKVGAGEYEQIDEDRWSDLDMEVHEHPMIQGSVGQIYSQIDHQDFRGVSHYVTKHNDYSSWEAARFLKLSADSSSRNRWSWKQKLKYWLLQTPLIGPVYFLGSFVFMGGWRDGRTGMSFAILKSAYFVQIACKIQELQKERRAASIRDSDFDLNLRSP